MIDQEYIQPSETSFSMKSQRFHCAPCNREFSALATENGTATCPRCDNVCTQASETAFHMKSERFYCAPCNREFSYLTPENGRAICPRCDNATTRRADASTHSQTRNSTSTTNANARRQQTSTQSQSTSQQRPQQRPVRQPSMFRSGPGIFMQTVMPGVYFFPDEQAYMQQEYDPFGGMFGFGNMLGMGQQDMFGDLFGGYRQPSTQYYYTTSPFDLMGGRGGPVYMMGDRVITPEEYERLVEEFIQSDPNKYGPPPAKEEHINKLKEFNYEAGICKNVDCSVCQEDYKKGDKCVELPCEHTYHKDCVTEWLTRHDSCPICRKPLDPKANSNRMEEERNPNRMEEEVVF